MLFRSNPDVVLLDLRLPGMSGMELLDRIVEQRPLTDVILLTGDDSTERAVQAIQKGACDYLTKPIEIEFLQERVGKLIRKVRERYALESEQSAPRRTQFAAMVGSSGKMTAVFSRLQRIAPYFRTVLVTGETGTGKELAARALHALSPASSGPFVICNCAAVVDSLFETELFGHVRGAFTGALHDRVGLFESAQGGTLFLDEVGELPLGLQAKLLRVLQNHEVQRVGSNLVRRFDVRVIAATNRDLEAMALSGSFRMDLYYRLSAVQLGLPRLADRMEDLPLLARHFLKKYAQEYDKPVDGLTNRAHLVLARHGWPGNVRELENVIGHACMMATRRLIDVSDLPAYLQGDSTNGATSLTTLREVEKQYAQLVLKHVGGNKRQAAHVLGISRTTLYRILTGAPLPASPASLA